MTLKLSITTRQGMSPKIIILTGRILTDSFKISRLRTVVAPLPRPEVHGVAQHPERIPPAWKQVKTGLVRLNRDS